MNSEPPTHHRWLGSLRTKPGAPHKQAVECGDDVAIYLRAPDDERQTLVRVLIMHRQQLERPPILGSVEDEVVAPDVVRPLVATGSDFREQVNYEQQVMRLVA